MISSMRLDGSTACLAIEGATSAEVFREYQRPIYNYLLRITQNQAEAEDLTQETFVRAHRSLPSFRGEASLSTWLYRIATNVSFDHFRQRTTRQDRIALPLEKTEFDKNRVSDLSSSPE
jgi:RNA polymerase sigma-70 factor (ECF subfamily)